MSGQTDPLGTCILIEIESLNELVQYFQDLHKQTSNFGLRGIKVFKRQIDDSSAGVNTESVSDVINNPYSYDECFVLAIVIRDHFQLYLILIDNK